MDVRIGVVNTVKEIEVELPADADRAEIRERIESALGSEGAILWLTDRHGAEFAVPAEKVAYVQLGRADGERRIGFSG